MSPIFLLSGVGMMFVGLITVVYWKLRHKILWRLFLWGALAWTAGVALKILVAAVANKRIISSARGALPEYLSEPLLWLYIGLLTGIFECGATLVFAYIKKVRNANFKQATAFGLGFGAVEAFLVGLSAFLMVLLVILIPNQLPEELVKLVTSGTHSPLVIPAPVVERICAILLHALSCVLIIYAVRTKAWKWFWLSFAYKTAVDGVAGLMHLENMLQDMTLLRTWAIELVFLPFGIVGLWGLYVFRRRWQSIDATLETPGDGTPDDPA